MVLLEKVQTETPPSQMAFQNFFAIEFEKVPASLLRSLPVVGFIAWPMSGKILIAATYGFTLLHQLHNLLLHSAHYLHWKLNTIIGKTFKSDSLQWLLPKKVLD